MLIASLLYMLCSVFSLCLFLISFSFGVLSFTRPESKCAFISMYFVVSFTCRFILFKHDEKLSAIISSNIAFAPFSLISFSEEMIMLDILILLSLSLYCIFMVSTSLLLCAAFWVIVSDLFSIY